MDNRRPRQDRNRNQDKSDQQWQEQVISIDRVARVVKGGRRFRFRALVAVGDGKTKVGVGVSKGADVQAAITKAVSSAKKDMVTIPIARGTIPHEVTQRYSGAKVMLKPAAPGTGVIAGGSVRQVLDVTGIQNILSKSLGSNNKINNAYAVIEALRTLLPRDKWLSADSRAQAQSSKAKEPILKKTAVSADEPSTKVASKTTVAAKKRTKKTKKETA